MKWDKNMQGLFGSLVLALITNTYGVGQDTYDNDEMHYSALFSQHNALNACTNTRTQSLAQDHLLPPPMHNISFCRLTQGPLRPLLSPLISCVSLAII